MAWGVNNNGWWGEGEIKFYIDGDKEFPNHQWNRKPRTTSAARTISKTR